MYVQKIHPQGWVYSPSSLESVNNFTDLPVSGDTVFVKEDGTLYKFVPAVEGIAVNAWIPLPWADQLSSLVKDTSGNPCMIDATSGDTVSVVTSRGWTTYGTGTVTDNLTTIVFSTGGSDSDARLRFSPQVTPTDKLLWYVQLNVTTYNGFGSGMCVQIDGTYIQYFRRDVNGSGSADMTTTLTNGASSQAIPLTNATDVAYCVLEPATTGRCYLLGSSNYRRTSDIGRADQTVGGIALFDVGINTTPSASCELHRLFVFKLI